MLTTITPYWGREQTLGVWLAAVKGATLPGLKHIVFFVGEPVPDWIQKEYGSDPQFHFEVCLSDRPGDLSIGHYHNLGARMTETKWMMKLDVDTLPNERYFKELLTVLRVSDRTFVKQWFNGGMIYVSQAASATYLTREKMPLSEEVYQKIMGDQRTYCGSRLTGPCATMFICRTETYLELGGCDERFRGYGWEDYQQIFALEWHERGRDPLPGVVTFETVHRRCCHEISRVKARQLLNRSPWLCLLHRFHPSSSDRLYKSPEVMRRNREVLLDNVMRRRQVR